MQHERHELDKLSEIERQALEFDEIRKARCSTRRHC